MHSAQVFATLDTRSIITSVFSGRYIAKNHCYCRRDGTRKADKYIWLDNTCSRNSDSLWTSSSRSVRCCDCPYGILISNIPLSTGSFYDYSLNYNYTFYLGGGLLSLSGLIGVPLRIVAKRERKENEDYENRGPPMKIHLSNDSNNFDVVVN